MTLVGPSIATVQTVAAPLHPPPQPRNTEPADGVALRLTCVNELYAALHRPVQLLMPTGELVTAPLPPTPIDSV